VAIDGILNLDKPKGTTSFGVVAHVRRLSGERRVGHAGTLDPDATGVLVVCLGKATRLVEYLADARKAYRAEVERKAYRAEVEFGTATDTYDASGQVVQTGDASGLERHDIENAAAAFVGKINQVPPAYSALKHRGVPLYRWARAGVEVPIPPRQVEFFRIDVVEWKSPVAVLEVECGKGAYIRSLAHDLGCSLQCGAHMRNLVRSQSGPFHIADATGMEQVEDAFKNGEWAKLMLPMDSAIAHLPRVTISGDAERAVLNGRTIAGEWEEGPTSGLCRAYGACGEFIAILACDEEQGCWRPRKVFFPGPTQS